MKRINEMYRYPTTPLCNEKAVVKGEKYRFTVLTHGLIRMEYNEKGIFEDRATKGIVNRNFPVPHFTVEETEDVLVITTETLRLNYLKKYPFTPESLTARYCGELGNYTQTWTFKDYDRPYYPYPGQTKTRKGTIGSLDAVHPPIELDDGIISDGYTDYDDSKSMIIAEDGWVEEREDGIEDTYLFAYGKNNIECLHDFLELSGKLPMLPRSVLGNWWCRYHAYDEKEYKELLKRFDEEGIPLTVALIDMDWHITDIEKQHGTGWTGYSWNKNLFPDPEEFLKYLHNKGLYVGLNLHDREGIGAHEDNYREMAIELGQNPDERKTIQFDFGSPKYVEAYFKHTHHNNEKIGVNFWWTDGFPKSNVSGGLKYDIPWLLNHYHYVDNCKNNNRGVIFSRYAGIGSQRYPMGFSGDTYATWDTLDFMPYFTATASNVGFGWWGHDIGGFMGGERNEEMMSRWTQFGAFSPITRMHCSDNPFMGKEPWNFSKQTHDVMVSFLKLRHKLLPYIYTMNHTAYADNIPIIRPIYYYHKTRISNYNKNEYYFGDQMIVSPITKHTDPVTLMACTDTYMPEGLWFDFFNDRKYLGERIYKNYRTNEEMPVFVKAGGIIPMTADKGNSIANPKNMEIRIYPGADNTFELYEDDGVTNDYQKGICCKTLYEYKWEEQTSFTINKPEGKISLVPEKRNYELVFKCIADCDDISVKLNGKDISFEKEYSDKAVKIRVKDVDGELKVSFNAIVKVLNNDIEKEFFDLVMSAQMSYGDKEFIYKEFECADSVAGKMLVVNNSRHDEDFRAAATEILMADTQ